MYEALDGRDLKAEIEERNRHEVIRHEPAIGRYCCDECKSGLMTMWYHCYDHRTEGDDRHHPPTHGHDYGRGYDVCLTCIAKTSTADHSLCPYEPSLINLDSPDKSHCSRGSHPVVLELQTVAERRIPEEVASLVTGEMVTRWCESLDSITEITALPLANTMKPTHSIGSLRGWIPFTDWIMAKTTTGVPFHADCILLVCCEVGSSHYGRVASGLADDHGRIAINEKFLTVAEYLVDRDKYMKLPESDKTIDYDLACDAMPLVMPYELWVRYSNGLLLHYG